ncbi:helix-turn-helix domain-containing protein [Bacillus cereus]
MQPILVNKTYTFRIYPNKKQKIIFAKTIDCNHITTKHINEPIT